MFVLSVMTEFHFKLTDTLKRKSDDKSILKNAFLFNFNAH